MSVFGFLSGLISPVTTLIDGLHTSEEEKGILKNQLYAMQSELSMKILEYETKLVESQASVVKAEATGHSWLQRNWRPGLMTLFGFIIFWNYILQPILSSFLPIDPLPTPDELWSLMKLGLGGYVIGRSAEKVVPKIVDVLKS